MASAIGKAGNKYLLVPCAHAWRARHGCVAGHGGIEAIINMAPAITISWRRGAGTARNGDIRSRSAGGGTARRPATYKARPLQLFAALHHLFCGDTGGRPSTTGRRGMKGGTGSQNSLKAVYKAARIHARPCAVRLPWRDAHCPNMQASAQILSLGYQWHEHRSAGRKRSGGFMDKIFMTPKRHQNTLRTTRRRKILACTLCCRNAWLRGDANAY